MPATHPDSDDALLRDAGVDLHAALRRLGGDAELLREMAAIVVQDAPGLLAQAVAGLDSDERETAARAAHSLKGLASNFSNPAAGAAEAAEIELRRGDRDRAARALRLLQALLERLIEELQRTALSR